VILASYGDVILARQPAPFNLTVDDQLESWLRMGTLSQNLVQRARILLLLNAEQSPKDVMESLDVSSPTLATDIPSKG